MARVLVLTLFLACFTSLPGEAQTTDGGLDAVASPSIAAVAKGMHATIRRNLAEAAANMPAEHYGNIVVYMRLKGHVPPSTARAQQPPKKWLLAMIDGL